MQRTAAYYGKGAGGRETASVMYEDLLDINKRDFRVRRSVAAVCQEMITRKFDFSKESD